MATVNLGRIKPVFRGAYSGSTAYIVDDIVTSGGSSYICIQAHGAGTQAVTQTAYWSVLASTGTDISTTLTTSGDILYRDGSGLQRLAKGTASQTLQMDGSAAFPTWTTVAAATSDFVKLGTTTLGSDAADVDLDLFDDSTYFGYKVLIKLKHDAAGNAFYCKLRNSSGDIDNSNYWRRGSVIFRQEDGASNTISSGNDTSIRAEWRLMDWGNHAAGHEYAIWMEFMHMPNDDTYCHWRIFSRDNTGSPYLTDLNLTGWNSDNSTKTGLRFYTSTGNIQSGSMFTIYGYKK